MTQKRQASQRQGRRGAANSGTRRGLWFETLEERRLLVIVASAAANDTALSLETYGGPGDPDLPGYNNVGRGSSLNSTVFYLGGGWGLTANHVDISNPNGVFFGNGQYAVDTTSKYQLHDPITSGPADLQIFRIYGDPGLPTVLPAYIPTTSPSGHVYMIGNGLTRGMQRYWWVTGSNWAEDTTPPFVYNFTGFDEIAPRRIRWGENQVYETGQFYDFGTDSIRFFSTYFGGTILTHEAQGSGGDSGGPVFWHDGSKWVVSGIMITTTGYSGQPQPTAVFGVGNQTWSIDLSQYRDEILSVAGVVGRHIFYNQSAFDNDNAGIDADDDAAIATDKTAYFPGAGLATSENVTSYSRGINGIMVDLASDHGTLSLDDFSFKMSPQGPAVNNEPSTWVAAPTPTGFAVRAGAGDGESDRVEFVWAAGDIVDRWLQVTVEGDDAAGGFNTNTGLIRSDIFYFGNKIGDTFTFGEEGAFVTNATDQLQVRNNQGDTLSVTNIFDFSRDFSVNATDQLIARNSQGDLLAINIANPPGAPLPGPLAAPDDDGGSAVASALASSSIATESVSDPPRLPPPAVDDLAVRRASRQRAFELLAQVEDAGWQSLGDDLGLGDDLAAAESETLLSDLASALEPLRLPGPRQR